MKTLDLGEQALEMGLTVTDSEAQIAQAWEYQT